MIDPTKALSLRKSINARIRSEAKRREVLSGEIRKQYVFSLFFKRLFAHDVDHWMLLGGNTLLIRIGEGDSLSSSHQKAPELTGIGLMAWGGATPVRISFTLYPSFACHHADLRLWAADSGEKIPIFSTCRTLDGGLARVRRNSREIALVPVGGWTRFFRLGCPRRVRPGWYWSCCCGRWGSIVNRVSCYMFA